MSIFTYRKYKALVTDTKFAFSCFDFIFYFYILLSKLIIILPFLRSRSQLGFPTQYGLHTFCFRLNSLLDILMVSWITHSCFAGRLSRLSIELPLPLISSISTIPFTFYFLVRAQLARHTPHSHDF